MKLSWFWVVAIAVAAYYYGRNHAMNAAAGDPTPGTALGKLAVGLTPGKAIADALEPTSPAAGQTNPPGSSAWMP